MIFSLNFKVTDLKSIDNIPVIGFIEFISEKIKKGEHVFIGSIELFKGLSVFPGISQAASKIFSTHSRNLAFMGEFRNFDKCCEVKYIDEDKIFPYDEIYNILNLKKIILERLWGYYFSESVMVFEHFLEKDIYTKVFNLVSSFRGDNFIVNFSVRHGGGNDTANVAEYEFNNRHNVFCICDSDIKHLNSNVGQTAKNVKKKFEENNRNNFYLILGVHEVENIIPSAIYEQTARNEQSLTVEFMKYMENNFPDHLLCYDIKDAHTYENVFCIDNEFSRFWKPVYVGFVGADEINRIKLEYESGADNIRLLPKLSGLCKKAKENFLEKKSNDVCVSLRIMAQWDLLYCFMLEFLVSSRPIRI
ncbi:MAG: hypothetical protein J0M22_01780 [Gammaproteobacteria bacterium]|nr:hypothetical protein [Gammaproteobacteria bacterium]